MTVWIAVCCSVLQCVAVCCGVLHCVYTYLHTHKINKGGGNRDANLLNIHIHIYIHIFIHVCIYIYTHTSTYIYTHVQWPRPRVDGTKMTAWCNSAMHKNKMYVCTYVYIYTCTHMYVYKHAMTIGGWYGDEDLMWLCYAYKIYIYVCTYVYIYICICIHLYECLHTCIFICTYVYICMQVMLKTMVDFWLI